MSESEWIHRAQSAESRLNTLEESVKPMKEKIQRFKSDWGIREMPNGAYDIDFDKFADNLGTEQALVLRAIIDEKYQIRGNPGEKPRIRVGSGHAEQIQ